MSVTYVLQTAAQATGAAARHSEGPAYLAAFLSSSAVEVIAIVLALAFALYQAGRGISQLPLIGRLWARAWRGFDVFQLYKLIIPAASLAGLLVIWVSTVSP